VLAEKAPSLKGRSGDTVCYGHGVKKTFYTMVMGNFKNFNYITSQASVFKSRQV